MSLRDELDEFMRNEVTRLASEHPPIVEGDDPEAAMSRMFLFTADTALAVRSAVLRLAEEVDALKAAS